MAIIKNKNSQHGGWKVQPRFQLTLHYRDKALMIKIQKFFNVGKISKEGPKSICLQVQSIKELETVINHFAKFELKTKKHADFMLFLRIHEMKKRKEHLTKEGLMEIVAIKASMNRGLSEKLKLYFPDVVPVVRPIVENQKIKDPNWLVGFSSAEGCFFIHVYPDSRYVTGFQVKLVFEISQHIWDEIIMRSLVEFLKCGVIFKNREAIYFRVTKFHDITDKIIPFFKKYRIHGVKALDFADFCQVAELMKDKKHLTAEGLDQIRKIKAGMNTSRKIS